MIEALFRLLPRSSRRLAKSSLLQLGSSLKMVPVGAHPLFDIRKRLRKELVSLIFDVGANTGQSIFQFETEWPGAKILSFEPDPATFKKLKKNVGCSANVEILNLGLSSSAGVKRFDNRSPVTEL